MDTASAWASLAFATGLAALPEVSPPPEATASYDLAVQLDPTTQRISATGTVTWVHRGKAPVDALWWHLYLNAFRNTESTFMKESGGQLRGDEMVDGEWGYIEVTRMEMGRFDLLKHSTFETPDDENSDDRTVLRTPLPAPLRPGEQVSIDVAFSAQLPRVFARTGYGGTFFLVAQWFPKVAVLEGSYRDAPPNRWNAHQFHASSEFFADFGDYRVAITVPEDHVVGATGRAVRRFTKDGSTTVIYEQDHVHDFAWTADPRFVEETHLFEPTDVPEEARRTAAELLGMSPSELELPPVQVRLLLQPEHTMFAERYRKAIFASLTWFGLLYGPYPYETLTLVDGPRQARGAMGMEYPTFIAGGSRWPQPSDTLSPELVTVHEFGHQYWYGLVASNEFEEAWLDEGFNTYSTGIVLDRAYGPLRTVPRVLGVPMSWWFHDVRIDQGTFFHIGVLRSPDMDPIVQPAWTYRSDRSYGVNSYPRPALFLRQVEAWLGAETFARAMRTYALRYRWKHPTTEDFLRVLDEVATGTVSERLRPLLFEPGALDYAVVELESDGRKAPRGVFERTDPDDPFAHRVTSETSTGTEGADATRYETKLVIERKGAAEWPVTVEVGFEDGTTVRKRWDGAGRWKRFEWVTPARATWARLHPEGQVPLDIRRTNDSRRRRPDPLAGRVWGAHGTAAMQALIELLGVVF